MNAAISFKELSALYEKKCEECNLAGTIGQVLLEENEQLKSRVEELESSFVAGVDTGLVNEIQQSLIQQSRQLRLQLEEEVQSRLELEQKVRDMDQFVDVLVQKNNALKKKLDVSEDSKYKLQQQISQLENQVEDLSGTIAKLKMENIQNRNEIDQLTAEMDSRLIGDGVLEEPFSFMKQRDKASIRSLHSVDNKSIASMDIPLSPIRQNAPVSPSKQIEFSFFAKDGDASQVLFGSEQSRLNSECMGCSELKELKEQFVQEREELKGLLDKSYEAFERLQQESMMSVGNVTMNDSMIEQELVQLREEYDTVCKEKESLQTILEQTQEAYDELQNESMLSRTQVAETLQTELIDLRQKHTVLSSEKKKLEEALQRSTKENEKLQELVTQSTNASLMVPDVSIQVNDVQSHAIQAKELLEGTRNEILEAQSSITAAITDLVSQYQNAIKTPSRAPTPRKKMKDSKSFSAEALIEAYEMRNRTTTFRKRPLVTPLLGLSPTVSLLSLNQDLETPKAKSKPILKELKSLQMPSATRNTSQSKESLTSTTSSRNPAIESLTYTMIGSYFLKYNRFQKSPQLRYCWINPYSRTLHWALQPTTEQATKSKSADIIAVQWRDSPLTPTNVPPTELNSLVIATQSRFIKLLPISWEIHDHWVKAIALLLKRNATDDQFKMMQEYQRDDDATPKGVEVLTGSDATMRHRRVHTMISLNAPDASTPRKLKEHHRRLTVQQPKDNPNPFLVTGTPRKRSSFFQ